MIGPLALAGFALIAAAGMFGMFKLGPRFVEWSHAEHGDDQS